MTIIFKDGGKLETSEIIITGSEIVASDIYIVPIEDIEVITD